MLLLALGGAATYAVVQQGKKWQAYKKEHNCVIVGHADGDTFVSTGVDAKGNVVASVGTTMSKTGWKCDDGVTYWK